jgi:hypothetical protein
LSVISTKIYNIVYGISKFKLRQRLISSQIIQLKIIKRPNILAEDRTHEMYHTLFRIIVLIHNIHVDIAYMLSKVRLSVFAIIYGWLVKVPYTKQAQITLLRALTDRAAEVTSAVKFFYRADTFIVSASSMRMWLKMIRQESKYLDILFVRNNAIVMSRVDLNNDKELLTNSDVDYGDMHLDTLPAKVLFEYQ